MIRNFIYQGKTSTTKLSDMRIKMHKKKDDDEQEDN